MQFDRLLLLEKRSHWCCRLHVSKLRVDWQFGSVSTGLIRSPLLLGVCVCVHVSVCICIQLKPTYTVGAYCSFYELHAVVMGSGFLVHRKTHLHLHAHTQVNICPQGTYHCYWATVCRECEKTHFPNDAQTRCSFCSSSFIMQPVWHWHTILFSLPKNQHKIEKIQIFFF